MPSFKNGHCSIFTLFSLGIYLLVCLSLGIFIYDVAQISTNHKPLSCISINKSNCNPKNAYSQYLTSQLAWLYIVQGGKEDKSKTDPSKIPTYFREVRK